MWGARGGVAIFPTPAVSFDLGVGYSRRSLEFQGQEATQSRLGVDVGVSVYFGR